MTDNIVERAQGCLVGAFVGDAAGARLEFIGHKPIASELDEALAMKGGGVFRVAPGQVTDDGELTLALGRALVGEPNYPIDKVANNYHAWYQSHPFDVGNATSAALGDPRIADGDMVQTIAKNAAQHNMASKANGALMRATPLGLWSTRKTLQATIEAARADARLTHPNPACQWANVAYVAAIRELLLSQGDVQSALDKAESCLSGGKDESAVEVQLWLQDAKEGNLPACHPMAGFVRIAFTHAFHHLRSNSSFEQALRSVLSEGGDTDTNACIVGGLVGARVGVDGIPEHMRDAVLKCDTSLGRPRPVWLQTKDVLSVAAQLLS